MLDPIYNQGLRLCLGAFRTSPLESLYVDAHEMCLVARHAKPFLQYASKTKSLPKHPTHDAVFDNKYMKLFDARPNAIRTFGPRISQFLTVSNTDVSDILETPSYFCVTTWWIKPPKTVLDLMHPKKAFHGITRQVPWLYSSVYRWFTGWEFCGLCYSFSIKHP